MEKLLEKMDSYKIFNYLFPGAVFTYLFERIYGMQLVQGNLVENLFVYYFVGMIISRVGSIFIEPICKKIKWVVFEKYEKFIFASQKDDEIKHLSEENNTYRTLFAGCVILLISKLYFGISAYFKVDLESSMIFVLLLMILFALSYRKQTKYVVKRIRNINEIEKKK